MLKVIVLACAVAQLASAFPQGSKIIGGQESKQGQFPALVSLQDKRSRSHFCGGGIISTRLVVTAGHCFYGNTNPANSVVVAGTNDLSSGGTVYELESVRIHENYDSNQIHNDITLLKTAKAIVLGNNVGTLKLPAAGQNIPDGTTVTALGWGTIRYPNQNYPDISHFVELGVVSNTRCTNDLQTNILATQICVGGDDGKGLCFGDSGSPLILNGDTTIGIVSWGQPCGIGYPDVFTRTSSFVNWINTNSKILMADE